MILKNNIKIILFAIFPIMKSFFDFKQSITNKVSFLDYIRFRFVKRNKSIYWPVHKNSEVTHPQNIYVGINSNLGTRPGCYIQGNGGIYVGNYVHFASNIGVISGNHDVYNHMQHINKEVRINDYCWIGMNVVILPGVELGPRTIVGAGSIVTKSFPEGYCIIAGNPAKLIKLIEKEKYIPTKYATEYYGFIPKVRFKKFAKKHLNENKYIKFILNTDN